MPGEEMPRVGGASHIRAAYFVAVFLTMGFVVWLIAFSPFPQVNLIMSTGSKSTDVVVVGGGLAGLSASIEAATHGAHVTIIEKEKGIGGNSAKATSGINGAGTAAQKGKEIGDSVETFAKDTLSSGDGLANPDLVKVLAQNSASAHDWLGDFGLDLSDVVQLGGHSIARTHRFPPKDGKPVPVGFTILNTLRKHVEENYKDRITINVNSKFDSLIKEGERVVGVKFTDADGNMKEARGNVILSAGGFANDHTDTSLLDKYAPELSKYPTTNGPWATGDIIKLMEPQGVSLIHMDKVQVHPTGFVDLKNPNHDTKFLAPEALRGVGAILVDANGKRFANELGRRDYLTGEIMSKCSKHEGKEENPIVATMILTDKMIDKFGPAAGFYKFKGLIIEVLTLKGASKYMNVEPSVLINTVEEYNEAARKGKDEFGKTAFPTLFHEDDRIHIAFITPSLHYCMGGIEINSDAQVIQKGSGAIPGLYSAGENSGGVHGNNRLGGNSLLECVVFGRIAGHNAAHFA